MRWNYDFFERQNIDYQKNAMLSEYTTFRVGGPCKVLVKPKNTVELRASMRWIKENDIPYFILGNGSDVLAADTGFDGAVIQTSGLSTITFEKDGSVDLLVSGAGVSVARLCSAALEHSLTGLEFAWGIPGSVGGAVYMNAGAYGGEIKDVLYDCVFLDNKEELRTLQNKDLDFSYRHSLFADINGIVLQARFAMNQGEAAEIKAKMDDYITRRKTKQPLEYPSAGSTFKRPKGNYASALIEQCGLKGFSIGGAQISEKHSGFIINKGGATCADILALMRHIQKVVFEQTGYRLEPEVKMLGF